MVAWVTAGLVAPGVQAASGSTPPGTARAWHSAPWLSTVGTGAAVAGGGGTTGAADAASVDGAPAGAVVAAGDVVGVVDTTVGAVQAAASSTTGTADRFTAADLVRASACLLYTSDAADEEDS